MHAVPNPDSEIKENKSLPGAKVSEVNEFSLSKLVTTAEPPKISKRVCKCYLEIKYYKKGKL